MDIHLLRLVGQLVGGGGGGGGSVGGGGRGSEIQKSEKAHVNTCIFVYKR